MSDGWRSASHTTTVAAFRERLDELVGEGRSLASAVQAAQTDLPDQAAHPETVPQVRYQRWYTESARVIERMTPERADEFRALYDPVDGAVGVPSSILEYGIRHYLSDAPIGEFCRFCSSSDLTVDLSSVVRQKLATQVAILEAARVPFESVLVDLRGSVQAKLFDSKLAACRHLHSNGYFRAAGAVAGVVLEAHLQSVCSKHELTYHRPRPTISDLLHYLRDHGLIDHAMQLEVQALADVRNLCDHNRDREPTDFEVEDLIDGVDRVIKAIH